MQRFVVHVVVEQLQVFQDEPHSARPSKVASDLVTRQKHLWYIWLEINSGNLTVPSVPGFKCCELCNYFKLFRFNIYSEGFRAGSPVVLPLGMPAQPLVI